MHGPLAAARVGAASGKEARRREFPTPARAMETYQVLGRTLTTFVSRGMTKEQSFIKAVEEAGGRVFRKFYSQFNKYEITAIVFQDAALVKNDPEHIASQDFSFFGKGAERIRRMALKEARKSKGGVHFFEDGAGIPIQKGKGGDLVFLSPDEMLAGGGRAMNVRVVDTNIDPKTLDEFREGARALREGDRATLERMTRAAGAHSQSRERSIDPLATYTLLDARTGEEMGAAAANSKLGHTLRVAREDVFVPENFLISRFIADAARLAPQRTERAAWEMLYVLPKPPDDDSDGRFAMKVYSVCRFGQASQEDAHGAPIEQWKANARESVSHMALFDAFPQTQVPAKERVAGAPAAQNPQAMMFDGFAPLPKPAASGVPGPSVTAMEKPETKRAPAPAETPQAMTRARFERHAIVPKAEAIIPAHKTVLANAGNAERKPLRRKMPEQPVEYGPGGMKNETMPLPSRRPRRRKRKPEEKLMERRPAALVPGNQSPRKIQEKKKGNEKIRKTPNGKSRTPGAATQNPKKPASPKQTKSNRPNRAAKRPEQGLGTKPQAPRKQSRHKNKTAIPQTKEKKTGTPVQASEKKAKLPETWKRRDGRETGKMRQRKMPESRNTRALQELLPLFTSRKTRAAGSSGRRRASGA